MKRSNTMLALTLAFVMAQPLLGRPAVAQDLEVFEEIEEQMQEIRQLELTDPLDISFMTRDEYIDSLAEEPTEEPGSGSGDDFQRVLVAFGFIEEDQDPDELFTGLLGESVAGFYDPSTQEMVVIIEEEGAEPGITDLVTFAHETVHAIQDQNFDLNAFNDIRLGGTQDTYLAVTALIEGDATLAQIDYLLENPALAAEYLAALEESEGSGSLDDVPAYFLGILSFPYNEGFEFAQALYDEGGWDLVNEGYENPPTTSEQIMHPDKYLDGEEGAEVETPDIVAALGDDWREIDADSHGEYIISIFLDDADLTSRQIERAHSGWGGDAYVAATNDEGTAIAWTTAWDSVDDADEFFRAIVVRESGRLDADVERDGNVVTITADDEVVQVIRDGDTITWLYGPDLETVETMAGEAQDGD